MRRHRGIQRNLPSLGTVRSVENRCSSSGLCTFVGSQARGHELLTEPGSASVPMIPRVTYFSSTTYLPRTAQPLRFARKSEGHRLSVIRRGGWR